MNNNYREYKRLLSFVRTTLGEEEIEGEDFSHWWQSKYFVYEKIQNKSNIMAVCSFIVTNRSSFEDIKNGNIYEYEITPYSGSGEPVLYFSTLIANRPEESLRILLAARRRLNNLFPCFKKLFSIATTSKGQSFLLKSGFFPIGMSKTGDPVFEMSEGCRGSLMFSGLLCKNTSSKSN